MLLLAFFTIVFTAVLTQELLGVSYYFNTNFRDTFSSKKCDNASEWELVSYQYLEVVPPYSGSSNSIRASKNSCTTSFPIAFLNGTLELTVYLRTVAKDSGLTVVVFNDGDHATAAVKYHRTNRNFITGWTVISIPIKQHTTGYIQLSGQSLKNELVIVDSLRYIPDNTAEFTNIENIGIEEKSDPSASASEKHEVELFNFEFDEIEGSGESEEDEDLEGSGEYETEPTVTDEPDETDEPSTEDPDIDNPEPEEEPNESSDDPGFWNAFTITFVSVGGFVVIGSVGVGAYYLGKNRGISENPPLDIEALETPSIITVPRVRSLFSDTPSGRFS